MSMKLPPFSTYRRKIGSASSAVFPYAAWNPSTPKFIVPSASRLTRRPERPNRPPMRLSRQADTWVCRRSSPALGVLKRGADMSEILDMSDIPDVFFLCD